MKILRMGLVFFLAGAGFTSQVCPASNYPPSFVQQTVRYLEKGPAVFVDVRSGILAKEIIAYKKAGPLAQSNPESIEAVLVGTCFDGEQKYSQTTHVKLGREWHQTGYMSMPLNLWYHLPFQCVSKTKWSIQVAFSEGNHWDSLEGQNYLFSSDEFWGLQANAAVYETHYSDYRYEINELAWKFIIEKLRGNL